MIPNGIGSIRESGIKSVADVRKMAALKFDAILVGEALVRSGDV
jgi:indole-3-glycerol phosphate synthase